LDENIEGMIENNKLKSNEFSKNENAKIRGNGYKINCTVLYWTKRHGGCWFVRLENGGFLHTRNLDKNKEQ
jgi:hypothetical protein